MASSSFTVSRSLTSAIAAVVVLGMTAVACGSDSLTGAPQSGQTDFTQHAVPLEDIIFDTFDGGSVQLSEADPQQIAALRDAIEPIRSPSYVTVGATDFLDGESLLIAYTATDGTVWGYPHRILNAHEIVNDTIAGTPVVVTFCPLCRSGAVFDRRPDDLRHDGVLTFGNTSALYNNDMVMIDDETNTYWWQVAGAGLVGSLTDAELTLLPSHTLSWRSFVARHPDARVLSSDLGFGRSYDRDPFAGYADRVEAGQLPFPVDSAALADQRLPSSARVISFDLAGQAFAVPVESDTERVVSVEHGGDEVTVHLDGDGGAYVEAAGSAQRWPSRDLFWFAFVAAYPEGRIAPG